MATFPSADLSFLSAGSLVCTARAHTCAQDEWTRVRRTSAHVCAARMHTNESQEKNDNSQGKTITTAGKNLIVCRDGKRKTHSRTAWQRFCPPICHFCPPTRWCAPLGRTRVHAWVHTFPSLGAHVCILRVHTNDSQEKSDKSLENNVATAGKNVIMSRDGKRKSRSWTAWQRFYPPI